MYDENNPRIKRLKFFVNILYMAIFCFLLILLADSVARKTWLID